MLVCVEKGRRGEERERGRERQFFANLCVNKRETTLKLFTADRKKKEDCVYMIYTRNSLYINHGLHKIVVLLTMCNTATTILSMGC